MSQTRTLPETDLDDPEPAPEQAPASATRLTPTARRRLGLVLGILAPVVFVIGTIGPPLFGRGVFLASDLVYFSYPWKAVDDPVALNFGHHGPVSDTVDAAFPAKATFGKEAREGNFVTWNTWTGGGIPLAPNSSGVVSPFALVFVLFPAWFAPAAQKLCQLTAAIGFTYLFARRLGTDRAPALFAGIAFAGSGFMVAWSNWEQTDVAAMIPALFWGAERYLQKRTLVSLAPLAVLFAAMLTGLFPAVVFYAMYVLVPYVLVRVLAGRVGSLWERFRTGAGVGVGLAVGAALAAAVIVPFAVRLGSQELGDRAQSPLNNLGLPNMLTSVAPKVLGLSTEGPLGDYFGKTNQTEAISFIGITTMILAVLAVCLPQAGRVPRGVVATLGAATAIVGTATYQGGTVLGLLQNLPAFDNSFIGRTRSILGFTLAVLAALGAQALLERRLPQTRARWAWAAAVVAVTLWVGAQAFRQVLRTFPPPGDVRNMKENLLLPVLVGAAALVVVVAMRSSRSVLRTTAMGAIVGLLMIESLSFAVPLLPNEDRATLYPETPGIRFLEDEVAGQRIAAEGRTFFGNATMLFGVRNVGVHAFLEPSWKEMLLAADPLSYELSDTFLTLHGEPETVGSPALDRLAARWWVGTPDHAPLGTQQLDGLDDASCDDPVALGGPSGEAPSEVSVEVPAGESLRGVIVRVCDVVELPVPARLVAGGPSAGDGDGDGGVLQLPTALGPSDIAVALPESSSTTGRAETVGLALDGAQGASVALATTPEGDVAAGFVRAPAADDGLRLAFADDLVIYERTTALPRVRWAGSSEVISNASERVEALAAGDVDADTVVLESASSSEGSGAEGEVTVVQDSPGELRMEVDAAGDGFVVVADAMQTDWTATLDGETVDLEPADHATVAVAVPEGEHEIVLRHTARGQKAGILISLLALVLLAGVFAWDRFRRTRTPPDTAPAEPAPTP